MRQEERGHAGRQGQGNNQKQPSHGPPHFQLASIYELCSHSGTRISRGANTISRRRQTVDPERRTPNQARAKETVEAIFEATARILQSEGRAGLNTNRVAELAGVSIGTLYSYFPNKEAIILAMARRETEAVRASVEKAMMEDLERTAESPVRLAVRALIKGYGRRNKARRILMETLIASGHSDEIARPVQAIADLIAEHGAKLLPKGARAVSPIALFVLTRAVDGIVRAATYEDAKFISSPEFEDELTHLVLGHLADKPKFS